MTVEELLAALERTWCAGDADAYSRLFSEEADFVDVLGRVQEGRATIAREHQELFTTIYRGSTCSFRLLSRRTLTEDVVLAHSVSRLQVPAGPREGVTHATQTLLVEHGCIAAFHNVVQSDLWEFAGQDARPAASAMANGLHRDPRI